MKNTIKDMKILTSILKKSLKEKIVLLQKQINFINDLTTLYKI